MTKRGIFIGATGQNVGKTTLCLGMIAALKKLYPKLSFMKPVGQVHRKVEGGVLVDKDVVLFKEHFDLPTPYPLMSPVIVPQGFTRSVIDQEVSTSHLESSILEAYEKLQESSDMLVVEGTGHVGVGSIIHLSNAHVASLLNLDMVIIAKGGLGSAFDELALNKALCDAKGVKIRGVILNKVWEAKREMIMDYMQRALRKWNIPLLGAIPYNRYLSTPSMEDFETLFRTKMLSGEDYHYRHFEAIRLVATSVETFREMLFPDQLIVTPATREDIISVVIEKREDTQTKPERGLILTGRRAPGEAIVRKLKEANIPALYAPFSTFDAMRMITSSFTPKIERKDTRKVERAIQLVENYLDVNRLIQPTT